MTPLRARLSAYQEMQSWIERNFKGCAMHTETEYRSNGHSIPHQIATYLDQKITELKVQMKVQGRESARQARPACDPQRARR